ncbi:hypothetical protein PHYPSEUDO_009606 [Phytophthora pseudosyringae]|uniref:Uncharacterized protein n=1 Tax=Phytophthora pseudosyringae TaxID=221518 RepID=A0A8T1WGZ4_9STRA|nr:hypothetical protein PHYPSEUDO_009606 [Phytophthora pseudosyringae]
MKLASGFSLVIACVTIAATPTEATADFDSPNLRRGIEAKPDPSKNEASTQHLRAVRDLAEVIVYTENGGNSSTAATGSSTGNDAGRADLPHQLHLSFGTQVEQPMVNTLQALALAASIIASSQGNAHLQFVEDPQQRIQQTGVFYVRDRFRPSRDIVSSTYIPAPYNPDALFKTGCVTGHKIWCNNEEVCLSPFGVFECAVDAISPIKLDEISDSMAQAVKDFANDPISTVIDFANETINDAVNDMVNCYTGIAKKKQPSCAQLSTFQACVNTGINVLSVAVPVAKEAAVGIKAISRVKKLTKGIEKMKKVADSTITQCVAGCPGKVCSLPEGTRTFSPPAGCSCRKLAFELNTHAGVTPAFCSEDMLTTDGAVKVQFKYVGCYVGVGGSSDGYEGCEAAVSSNVFTNGGMFVRCTDQNGDEGVTA